MSRPPLHRDSTDSVATTGAVSLFANLPPVTVVMEETEVLARAGGGRVERIVSRGQASPPGFWYDQLEAEWVLLLQGQAELRFADPDETVALKSGDAIWIAPRRRHRVEWTSPDEQTIWVAVFFDR